MYVIIQAYYNFKRENMLNFKFLKLSSVFFILAFVLFSHNVSSAQEQTGETLTKIEIKEVKIEKSDMELKISGVLFNPSKNVVTSEITHLLILKTIDPLIKPKSEIDLLPSLIVAADEGKDYFSLKPNEQKIFSYFLPISPYIPQASYDLYLGFIRSNGQIEVRYENTVKNLGSQQKDGFLAFDQESCVLLDKEGKKFGNNDGPVFLPEESPEARCLVKNIGDKEIEVSPKILWKEVYVYGKPLDGTMAVENPDQKIFFKPGETKLVSLSMPKAEKPQTYQGLITFEDKEGMSRSFNMFFRWTIAGESARIKSVMDKILRDGKFPMMLGGEHSITLGAVQAVREQFSDFSVLQIDAHSDLRDEFEGTKFHHACVMKRIKDLGVSVTQVGVRSSEGEELGDNVFLAPNLPIDKIISTLKEKVYLTFDLDGLDPSIMPSTGTPEPGGLGWYETLKLIKEVAKKRKIIGADVVELDPIPGFSAPDFLAAKLVYKIINYII